MLWSATDCLRQTCYVALAGEAVAGFIVARSTAPGESEILTLAVVPGHRRRGLAKGLIRAVVDGQPGNYFLEVRESNLAARSLYEALGFSTVGMRLAYYDSPSETAIVMRFQS